VTAEALAPESPPADAGTQPSATQGEAAQASAAPAPADEKAAADSKEDLRRIRSSPLVRKIAKEHGIDISQIEGTGLSGRVTKNDILSFIENRAVAEKSAAEKAPAEKAAPAQPAVAATQARAPQPLRAPAEPMSIMRRRIAERMVESRRTSAHVTSFMEVDFTETARLRDELKGEYLRRDGVKLTFLPFIIKAVIEGIKKWPIINSAVWGDQIVYKKDLNVGVAVALDWGLIVPVIRNADEKSLLGLARAVNDLGERARLKQLKPDEVAGGTFTITNPGVFGGLIGTPIINQPQVAILGVGVIKKRPVVIDDAIAIRQIGILSLSFDHRVIDGAVADQFLAVVRDVIEEAEYTS
jgi:2-oxoglutarate dehydrogenase E2 component (dihydrolipoamide succinyltransferase)